MNTPKSMFYFFMFLMESHWHSSSNFHWNTWQACYTKQITSCYIRLCKSWTIWYFSDMDASNLKILCNLNENFIYEIATNIKFMMEIVWHQYTKGQLMLKFWTKIMLYNSKTRKDTIQVILVVKILAIKF
jgi:pyruvate carboxylase